MFKPFSRSVSRLLVRYSQRVSRRAVVGEAFDRDDLAEQKLRHVLAAEEVTDFTLIKVRNDGRGVAKGMHPIYGSVAVKSWMAARNPFKAQANLRLSKLVQETGGGLFPQVYKAEDGYTVEAWTEGACLAEMNLHALPAAELVRLLDQLRTWSQKAAGGGCLYAEDVEELVLQYVLKRVNQIRYARRGRMLRRLWALKARKESLQEQLLTVKAVAQAVTLPQCPMLMDIGLINLIRSTRDGSIHVIDYEQIVQGHYGFDAVYILHSLRKKRAPARLLERLESHVFTPSYLGDEQAAAFFEAHYELLNCLGEAMA